MAFHEDIHKKIHKHVTDQHEWVKGKFEEIARKESTPHEVGLGFAIGLFIALATPGFDVLVALLIVLVFKSVHRLSLFFGVALINPITTAFIYPFSFKLGSWIVGYTPLENVAFFSLQNLLSISKPLLVGNLVLAIILGVVSYFLVSRLYYYGHYKRIEKKRIEVAKQEKIKSSSNTEVK